MYNIGIQLYTLSYEHADNCFLKKSFVAFQHKIICTDKTLLTTTLKKSGKQCSLMPLRLGQCCLFLNFGRHNFFNNLVQWSLDSKNGTCSVEHQCVSVFKIAGYIYLKCLKKQKEDRET